MSKSYCFYINRDGTKSSSKKPITLYDNCNTRECIDKFSKLPAFQIGISNSEVSRYEGISFKDQYFSIYCPPSIYPTRVFPQLKICLDGSNDFGSDRSPSLTLVPPDSLLIDCFYIYFHHCQKHLPPLSVRFQTTSTPEDQSIETIIEKACSGLTWQFQYETLAQSLNMPASSLILHYICEGQDHILFPFSPIFNVLQLLFTDEGNTFDPKGFFEYEFNVTFPDAPPDVLRLLDQTYKDIDPCSIFTVFSAIINHIIQCSFQEEASTDSSILTEFQSYLPFLFEYPAGCFASILFDNFFIGQPYDLLSKAFSDNISIGVTTTPSDVANFLIGTYILEHPTMPQRLFDTTRAIWTAFRQNLGEQHPDMFGLILYSSYVNANTSIVSTLILTRGFIVMLNFVPEDTHSHETIPPIYHFKSSLESVVQISIPVSEATFIPLSKADCLGIIITPVTQFFVTFPSDDAMLDFWILLTITQSTQQFPIQLNLNSFLEQQKFSAIIQLHTSLDLVHASVTVLDESWSVDMSLSEADSHIKKLARDCGLAFIPELQDNETSKTYDLSDISDISTTRNVFGVNVDLTTLVEQVRLSLPPPEQSRQERIKNMFIDMCLSPCGKVSFQALKIFKISDFVTAFERNSMPLFRLQLKSFEHFLPTYLSSNAPLLQYESLFSNNLKMFHELLKHINPESRDVNGRSALFYAMQNPQPELLQYLIQKGANPNTGDEFFQTPLNLAIDDGYSERVDYLVRNGAQPNLTIAAGQKTALHEALEAGDLGTFSHLLEFCGEEVNAPNYDGMCLTHICIQEHEIEALQMLAHVPQFDPNRFTCFFPHPIHFFFSEMSLDEDSLEVLGALLAIPGLLLNERDEDGSTPLCTAITLGYLPFIQSLVQDPRCDVEMLSAKGETPLFLAVKTKSKSIVAALIQGGALVNSPNTDCKTPLYEAVESGEFEIAKVLLNAGAGLRLWSYQGKFPMDIASGQMLTLLEEYDNTG